MSDDNEIEKPLGSDDGEADDDAEGSDFVFHVDRSVSQESPVENALKLFAVAYMALLLVALTLRVFERRK